MAELARCRKAAVRTLSFWMSRASRAKEISPEDISASTLFMIGAGGHNRLIDWRARSMTFCRSPMLVTSTDFEQI
jgi:hypothetical protein